MQTPLNPKFFNLLVKCRVDLFMELNEKFDYITSIWVEPNIEHESEAKLKLCESVRQTLYNAKKSTANNEAFYDYNYCIISIREYPINDKLVINNPFIIKDWVNYKGD